jgi:hypothetical protein
MGTPIPRTRRAERSQEPDGRQLLSRRRGAFVAGVALVTAGLSLIAIAATLDAQSQDPSLWPDAAFAAEGTPPWDGAVRTWVRHVPINNFPIQREIYRNLKRSIPPEEFEALPLDTTEWFLAVDLPPSVFEPLLASGRLPRRGTDEVLAGAFARADFVQVDDGAFHVVGRLKRGVGGLATAYVLPGDEVWEPLWFSTASLGWFDPNGLERIRALDDPEAFVKRFDVQGGVTPAALSAVLAALGGLVLVATGGGLVFQAAYGILLRGRLGVLRPAARSAIEHPRLVLGMHVFLYGTFFFLTLPTLAYPFVNVLMQQYIGQTFSEGTLAYVGEAYASGDVFRATFATWLNNFVVQTAGLTVLLSVIIPMSGVLKTAASFALAGLGMTPLWSGMPGLFLFHSITMVLELEAYIYACVAVCGFWLTLVRGVRERRIADAAHEALMMLLSATVLAGITLGIAALYEAATLLLLA